MGVFNFFKSKKQTPDLNPISSTAPLQKPNSALYKTLIKDFRYSSPDELLLKLSKAHPDVSNALVALMANVNTRISFVARKIDGSIDKSATKALMKILNTWENYPFDPNKWDYKQPLNSIINGLVKYAFVRGAVSCEIELNNRREPVNIHLIDPITVDFLHPRENVYVPAMKDAQGRYVKLDIPTFFYEVLVPEASTPYGESLILSVLETVFFSMEVIRDLERVIKKFGYPRYSAKVLIDILIKNAPPAIKLDKVKLSNYIKEKMNEIKSGLADTKPEEAFIFPDFVDLSLIESSSEAKIDFRPIIEILDQQISASLKTLPTILGRTIGKSGASQEEVVLYTKIIKMYQRHIASTLGKIFTMFLRLNGKKSFVEVRFAPVDLRSEAEIENHKIMKQKRFIEAVKLGWVDDYEACFELYGVLPKQESEIFGKYLELENSQLFDRIKGEGGDSPYTSGVDETDRTRRNTDEDILEEGEEPKPNQPSSEVINESN